MTTEHVEAPAAPAAAPVPAAAPPAAPAAAPVATAPAEVPPGAPAAAAPEPAPILGADAAKPLAETIPEKHRVMKADGTLDQEATLAKVEVHRASLEKKIGTGEFRPATADEYKLNLPPEMKALGDAALDPATVKAFQAEVFAAGLTQGQYDFVMKKYLEVAPTLVAGARAIDANAAIAELKEQWPVAADFQANVGRANAAIRGYAGEDAAGIFKDYGSDPRIVRMMAKIGAEMGEDKAPVNPGTGTAADVSALMKSEAYTNAKHPDHERVSAQVRDHFQRNAPKAA